MKMTKEEYIAFIKQSFNGLDLSMCMAMLFCKCPEKGELAQASFKLGDAHECFNESLQEALDKGRIDSPKIQQTGKVFLNELNNFKRLPQAKTRDILQIIKDIQKDAINILNGRR